MKNPITTVTSTYEKILVEPERKNYQLPDGMKCVISSESEDRLKFYVEIPGSTWFSIGYGPGMNSVDMVLFQPDKVTDLWSTGMWTPSEDDVQNYQGTTISESGGTYSITTFRDRVTGDKNEDYQFDECGRSLEFRWAASTISSWFLKHNKKGYVRLDLKEDCMIDALEIVNDSSTKLKATIFSITIMGLLLYF